MWEAHATISTYHSYLRSAGTPDDIVVIPSESKRGAEV